MHSPGASGPTDKADPRPRGSGAPRLRFRADIEGIRAFALMLALLCHGGVPLFAGGFIGVDMFFVISGFLITGLLVVEVERTGTISLRRFYAQRAKRLLPLATLVLIVTMVLGSLVLPAADSGILSGDILGAALHVVNWRFAAQSVDYFGPESAASPVMHYWSLSIEEQFYLVWALVVFAVLWFRGRRGGARGVRATLLPLVAAIFVLSFLYSLRYSAESPNEAYFSTLTRAWQIAAGALLALIPMPRLSPRWCLGLSLAALAAIVYAVLTLTPRTIYPGVAGLIPVLATAALIVAGSGAYRSLPQRLLELRPVVYVGGLSYAWYLWHYPIMILGIAQLGTLSYVGMTILVYAAVVPAAISHHLIGQPIRYSRSLTRIPRRAIAVGASCMVASVTTVLAVGAAAHKPPKLPESEVVGASKLHRPVLQASAKAIHPRPTGADARGDRGAVWEQGCMIEPFATESGDCVFGNPRARKTVVLFGDSHAMAMFGAANAVAKQRNWRLVALVKAGCPPYETTVFNNKVGREYRECERWHENALARIDHEQPKLILTAGSIWIRAMRDGKVLADAENEAALEEGYVAMLERLRSLAPDADIVALKDLPKSPHDTTDCVSEHMDDLSQCTWEKGPEYDDSLDQRAAKEVSGVKMVDLSPALCSRDDVCYGVIGDALVYRDNDHMTATFSTTLAPWLNRALKRIGI